MIDTILIVAENVPVVVIVVIHEQVAGVSVVVEVIGEMPHLLFEVIAVVYDFSCEVFLDVVLSDVAVLEVLEVFVAPVDESVHSVRRILIAQVAVLSYCLKAALPETTFVVPFSRERLVVLEHQFRIFLVGVNCVAEVDKVVVERGEVNPQTAYAYFTAVLAVCAAVDAGIAAAIAFVFTYCVDECFRRKAEFFDACFYLCHDCQFAEL